uniref:Protein FAM193A n=1 Tax=Cacopsylla melanoneura TaxID=428564 RepID=A0A8D8VE04_9HEMI
MTSSNSLTKKKQTLFVNMGDVLAKETEQVKVEEQSWDNREDADGASSVEDSIIRDLQERLSLTVGASDDNYESDDSNTQCDCDACQEPIMSIRNPHFDRVQEHWQKLRTFIQIVYKSAIQGKPLEPAYQKQIQSIIHELATLEPHLLYKQLEAQIQEWVIETELRQLESLLSTDNVDNIPHLFISGLLESYKNLMTGADLAFPILEELQASHLSKFNITWQLLNEHIYQSCVYADPLVQNNVPVFIGKLSSTSESMESNKDLVKEFLYLDDNINSVSELWVECKRALEEYAEEQALIQGRRALLEMEWKCFKAEGGGGGGSQRKTSLINKTLKKIVTSEKQCLHSKDGASCKRSKCVSESTSNKCASLACDCMKFSHDITLSHLHQGGTDQSHSPGRGGQCLLNGKIDLSSVVAEHKLCADSSCGGTTSVVNSLTFDLDIDERPTSSTQPHTPPSRVTSSANSSVPVSHSHPPANNTGIKTATTQKLMKAKVAAAADLAASLKCRSKAPPSSGGSSVRGGTCHKVRSGCSHHTHKHGGSSNVAPEPIKRIATCEAHRTAAGNSAQSHHEDEDSDTCGGGSCSSCTPPDDSASDQSSVSNQKSSSSNVSDPRHCDCCYCEVFGHGVPSGAPVSRNYQEIRERLRLLLNKKKNNNKKNAGVATATESSNMMHGQSNARSGTGDQQLLNKLPTPRHLSAQQLQQQQQQQAQQQQQQQQQQQPTNHNNNNNSTTSCNDTHHPSPTPPPPPSPAPSPTPMSFIPSKTLVNGSPVINDHTNRLQIVMDKPPTPTSGHYQETPTGTAHSQPQLLANKTQLQIVMDSQDHSQIALNDHQNRLQIVMNQPSPEAVLTSQPSPHQMTPTSIQSPLQITSSGLQITPSSLQSIQNSLQMTPSGLQITPSPLQITPTSLQAPLTRLNGSTSATHVQFVSPRTINTVIKTSQPQPTPLVNSTPLIPTSQSHPHLSLQPSSNPGSTEHKSPSFTPQTNSSYNGPTPISQSNPSYNGSTPQSTSCYTPGSTPPVFVNRPNLTVVTQPHPPVLLSSDHQNNDSSQSQQQQVPFRSMPQVCDTSPPSVITQTPTNNVRPQMKPPTPQPRPLPPTSGTHSSSPPHSNANTTQFPNPSSNSNNTHFNSSNNSSSGNTTHYNSSSSNAQNNAPYNSFLDTIAQQHPSILINKTLAPPSQPQPCNQPATSIIVKKPPVVKKSAVVKPMVMVAPNQEDGEPPSLVPLDGQNSSSVVQRVQTIQLTPQKQQHLKAVQNQITSLSAKDNKTSKDQATLQKLYKEQQSILLSGKIVPTIPGQHAQGLTFVSTPVRLVAPPTIPSPPTLSQPPQTGGGKSTSPVCVQVGTQTSDDSKSPPPVIAAPAEPSPSPHVTSSTTLSLSKRAALIEQQQARDILGATRPDTRTPFTSVSDAVKRLVRYHCLDDPVLSERDLSKADEIFEATAQHLLDKKAQMINKYKYLLIKESMRQVQTSELIMLGRMFVSDESAHLESLRQQAKNPPPTPTTTLVPSPCIDTPPSTISPSTSPSSSSCLKRDRDVDSPLYSRSEESGKRRCLGDDENETGRDECRDNEDMDMNDDGGVKTPGRCAGDDDEIKAQVQSAIDSILNLQRSDPATDEAVRSILGTGVTS